MGASSVDDLGKSIRRIASGRYYTFRPRPDDIAEQDMQTAFVESEANFQICLGGTGSGKTDAAAFKTAKWVLEQPAPRPETPFWVIGESYQLVCEVCWGEKLSRFIPKACIKQIDWYRSSRNWPHAVILHDIHGIGTNWVIEFKSFEQGREKFQAASIGGYWFNEECPPALVHEVHGRCRDYDSPGWADFTPLSTRGHEWPDLYEEPPDGWEFYHLNTLRNDALADGWAERYLAGIPEDMRDTRRIGTFASFKGQVFKEWSTKIHVVEPFEIPRDWRKMRGIDFGYANPFACIWVAKDRDNRYYVYREHQQAEQLIEWHAEQIALEAWNKNDPYCGLTYADPAAAQERAELVSKRLQDRGIAIPTATPRKDVLPGIECLRRLMLPDSSGRPRLFVFNTCEDLIKDIRGYHWPEPTGKDQRMRDPTIELPVPYRDHTIDALRYAVYSDMLASKGFPDPVKPKEKEWKRQTSRFLLK